MTGTVSAELLLLRSRASTWILLATWTTLAAVFAYAVPYATYLNDPAQQPLAELLPQGIVGNLMGGFPFFGGVIALMLGVLAFGSEFGWGTLKVLFTQRPGRLRVFAAKLVALALGLVPFVILVFVVGGLASGVVAVREGADVAAPSAWLILRGLAAGWLIMAVWASLGVMLAVLSRGTALAVGIGVLYGFVIEGLVSALASQVSLLDRLVEFFLRANGYSLVSALGVSAERAAGDGPGAFSGPFVSTPHALLVIGAYTAAFLVLSGWLLRRRDVV
ncbi:MAG: type transport system permease protein [Gaiellales bacterium]|jgi:ABC-type transport system involved in multi-copper enzyme maturation permease subunit|nr:type transport system permease protein [Gaiellales bacterium]